VTAEIPHRAVRAGEFDIHGLLAILDGHMQAVGARRVVLDAVDVLMRIFGDPEREREELHVLHDWLRDRGATAVITSKADTEGRQIYPFLDFLADCVLFLDQRTDRQVRTRRMKVVKYRGSDFLANEQPYVLTPRGAVLMPVEAMSMAQETSPERISSGHARLDEVLGGGLFGGSCILLAGPSGAGKTTLAEVCRTDLGGRCHVCIIDVLEDFAAAAEHQVLVTPTLVIEAPEPPVMVIGNLSDREKVRRALRLEGS
jgi:circadian clock protein KaiC